MVVVGIRTPVPDDRASGWRGDGTHRERSSLSAPLFVSGPPRMSIQAAAHEWVRALVVIAPLVDSHRARTMVSDMVELRQCGLESSRPWTCGPVGLGWTVDCRHFLNPELLARARVPVHEPHLRHLLGRGLVGRALGAITGVPGGPLLAYLLLVAPDSGAGQVPGRAAVAPHFPA